MKILEKVNQSPVSRALRKVGLSPISILFFLLIFLVPVTSDDEYFIRLIVTCLLRATLGMGFDLSAGYIGVANWGYSALMGLGGYTSALLATYFGLTPWVGLFVGAFASMIMGLFIGLLTLRMDGIFAALLAWFVGLILMGTAGALTDITRGTLGLQVESLFATPWATPNFSPM